MIKKSVVKGLQMVPTTILQVHSTQQEPNYAYRGRLSKRRTLCEHERLPPHSSYSRRLCSILQFRAHCVSREPSEMMVSL